jgi:hypothetical protein
VQVIHLARPKLMLQIEVIAVIGAVVPASQ